MDDEERCAHCRYFSVEAGEEMGECHRYPPAIMADDEGTYSSFPDIACFAWCGEFKRRVM